MKLERVLIFLCLNGAEKTPHKTDTHSVLNNMFCWPPPPLLLLLWPSLGMMPTIHCKKAQSNWLRGKMITNSSSRNERGKKNVWKRRWRRMEHERARCWHQSTQNHTIINIHVLLNLQFLNNKHSIATQHSTCFLPFTSTYLLCSRCARPVRPTFLIK